MLSDKVRMSFRPRNTTASSRGHTGFYIRYASVVCEALKKPIFQRFLRWMLSKESIEADSIKNVKVRIFPFQKQNGKMLAGRCRSKGEILIFPKRRRFCRDFRQKHGSERLLSFIIYRARAVLVHELLHMKYLGDEKKVRRLTSRYYSAFALCKEEPRLALKLSLGH